jgi:hypothetical protein
MFRDTGLSGCYKQALFEMWGPTLKEAYGDFGDAKCDRCGSVLPNVTLSENRATGMVSRIDVTVNTAGLPNGTVLGELKASPVTPFEPVRFAPVAASRSMAEAASGNLFSTGNWSVSFTLVTGSYMESCPLPVQSISCMPTFTRTASGGCECPSKTQNVNGTCSPIKSPCDTATFLPDPKVTQLTDNTTLSLTFTDRRDPSEFTVLMRPRVSVRTSLASNPTALLGLGQVVPGDYDIELEQNGSRCALVSVNVGCSAGYRASGGVNGTCISATTECDRNKQWRDPTTGNCRQKAEVAVRASSDKLQVMLTKTRSTKNVTVQLEVRLQSGDVDGIVWTATPGSSWISLGSSNGSVYSSKPAAIDVTADGTGLGDTATTGPISSNVTVRSTKAGKQSEDAVFVNGNDERTITVELSIKAVPYVSESHVAIASSASGRIVQPGEPVEAGDRLTVAVKAFDADGLPISRRDLPLIVEVKGKLNGVHSVPLELNSTGTNVYTATIPENWIKEPETVESDVLPSSVTVTTRFRLACPTASSD